MPLGVKPVCATCRVTTSTMWRKGPLGEVLCNTCGLKVQHCGRDGEGGGRDGVGPNPAGAKNDSNSSAAGGPVLRKSSRIKPAKNKLQTTAKSLGTKGKSRRVVFKKNHPIKAPTAVSTVITGDSIFHDGIYYQTGDIVSLVDHDATVYYAQIRGLLQDQYNEKSAVITWLIPSENSPTNRFDPSTYVLGPEEDLPRKLEYMDFVCHAPSDYFKAMDGPYPSLSNKPELSYIWFPLGSQIHPVPSSDEIHGLIKTVSRKFDKEKTNKKEKQFDKEKQ